MYISFRDGIGVVIIQLNNDEIVFDGMYAYITDANNRDYKIRIENIISIGKE